MASGTPQRRQFQDVFASVIPATATWDAGSILDGDEVATDVTVTGAAIGDFVLVSAGVDVADLTLTANVTAADTVTLLLNNNTGGAVDLASTTYYIAVLQPSALVTTA